MWIGYEKRQNHTIFNVMRSWICSGIIQHPKDHTPWDKRWNIQWYFMIQPLDILWFGFVQYIMVVSWNWDLSWDTSIGISSESHGFHFATTKLKELGRGSQGVAKLAKDAAGREFCVTWLPRRWNDLSMARSAELSSKNGWNMSPKI